MSKHISITKKSLVNHCMPNDQLLSCSCARMVVHIYSVIEKKAKNMLVRIKTTSQQQNFVARLVPCFEFYAKHEQELYDQ